MKPKNGGISLTARKQKIRLSSHALRRHRERAKAWGTIDIYNAAKDAWENSENRHLQSNGRWHVEYYGYKYVFALEDMADKHPDALQDVTLITYMSTHLSI